MGIKELWIPSPHYSGGRGPYNKIVFHTTEGAMKIRDLGAWFQNPGAQCSSHHGADNYEAGLLGAYVYESNTAWTQGNANSYCLSLEMCAYASWSRDTWLGSKNTLLNNAADWLRYCQAKYNVPWTVLNNSQAQNAGTRGICQHVNLGSWGSGHVDCGSGFPLDEVIKRAKGGGTTPPPEPGMAGINMPSCVYSGGLHQVGVWQDGRPHYQFEGEGWYQIDRDEPAFKALSGADICVTPTGMLIVSVTGLDKNLWTFQQKLPEGGGAAVVGQWGKYNRGGHSSLR